MIHSSNPRYAALDGLRTVAVAMVMLTHYATPDAWVRKVGVEWAFIGVHIFFVLSGFLITKILCERYERGSDWRRSFAAFWTSRAFRIVPLIFVAVLTVGVLSPTPLGREFFLYNLTFTSNFYTAVTGGWLLYSGHLWSIAIEMQFYLLYPFFVWRFRQNLLVACFGLMVVLVLAQEAVMATGVFKDASLLLTARADAFLWGAIVYWMTTRPNFAAISRPLFIFGGALYIGQTFLYQKFQVGLTVHQTIAGNIFFAGIVAQAMVAGTWLERALSTRPMVHLGQISYGLYVWHLCVWAVWDAVRIRSGDSLYKLTAVIPPWVLVAIVTVIASELTWRLFENRLNVRGRLLAKSLLDGGSIAVSTKRAPVRMS